MDTGPRVAIATALSCSLALAGCGGGSRLHTRTRAEPAQAPATLPAGWRHYRDYASGFSAGIPPGWRAQRHGDSLRIASPDGLVSVTVAADRTRDTLAVPPERLARATIGGLPGYRGGLRADKPAALGGTPLDGVSIHAVGTAAASGVPQAVSLVVLRRDHLVNYTLVEAANAETAPPYETDQGLAIARTIRDVPLGAAP